MSSDNYDDEPYSDDQTGGARGRPGVKKNKRSGMKAQRGRGRGSKQHTSSSSDSSESSRSRSRSRGQTGGKRKAHMRKPVGHKAGTKPMRSFKVIDNKTGKEYGRYTGAFPKLAASKGLTKKNQAARKMGKQIPKQSQIFVRESTQGSNKKVYGYMGTRLKLDKPTELELPDKVIPYHYRNKLNKIDVPDQIGGVPVRKSVPKKKTVVKKKSATKKVARRPVKKSAAKRPAAKRSASKKPVKRSTSKKPVKRAASKKPAKRTVAKKSAAKKPVKRTVAKKTVKKTAAKKPVKRTVAKKTATKKPAKRTASRKKSMSVNSVLSSEKKRPARRTVKKKSARKN